MCFTLRLHMSAAPPRGGLTQALGRVESMNRSSRTHRSRTIYAAAVIGVILLGLASRTYPWIFPAFLQKYPGDALWALMVLLILGFVWPKLPATWLAIFALVVSFTVEFGQLYRPMWLTAVRETTLGHLVLGSTFNPIDLVAYAIGVCIGFIVVSILQHRSAA